MRVGEFQQLVTPLGQEAIEAASRLHPEETDFLRYFDHLRKSYPDEIARAALETAILRKEAVPRFPNASEWYFTREALEQATSAAVAEYHARRFAGSSQVVDFGCSIGGDTRALANYAPTIGLDRDELRLLMARANLSATPGYFPADFLRADLREPLPLKLHGQAAFFFDPARRRNGKRVFSIKEYSPPLAVLDAWQPRFWAGGVKISPGVNLDELASWEGEVEFVSLEGELKEAVLWVGAFRSSPRRATVLPGAFSLAGAPDTSPGPISAPKEYLYEPDPSVLRAGLVQQLARQFGAAQLDSTIAYLTADRQVDTPFARVWRVEDWFPFQLKRLRAYLRERHIGRISVKKRGSPIQPETLIQQLRLHGNEEKTLVLTLHEGEPVVLVCSSAPLPRMITLPEG